MGWLSPVCSTMARLLPGVLLLAALCWTGESRDVCNSSTIAQAELCVKKVMNEKRNNLTERIDDLKPTFTYQYAFEKYTNYKVHHASNIQVKYLFRDDLIHQCPPLRFSANGAHLSKLRWTSNIIYATRLCRAHLARHLMLLRQPPISPLSSS